MKKNLVILLFILLIMSASSAYCENFSDMTKLWCTIYYKHWATSSANSIGYREISYYLYLDEANGKLYDEQKKEIPNVDIQDKEIKFPRLRYRDKKSITGDFVIDRYTGRVDVVGKIRHDYGRWASLTYDNRDYEGFGQCAKYSEKKKF